MKPAVDPQLVALLESFPVFDLSSDVLPAIRTMAEEGTAVSDPPPGVSRNEVTIPDAGGDPDIRALVYRSEVSGGPQPAVLFFHGGGLVLNSPESADARCLFWAEHLQVTIFSVAYRLAPENPFPAALNDGVAALSWIHGEAEQLGIDAGRIAIAGDSAGACIAASVALAEQRAGRERLCFMALLYPMLDDRTELANGVVEGIWSAKSNRFGWDSYLGQNADLALAVPARAASVVGLPPTWIGVGELDLFYAEDVAFAERLQAAGVACQLDTYPQAFHGFPAAADADVSKRLEQDYVNALKQGLAG